MSYPTTVSSCQQACARQRWEVPGRCNIAAGVCASPVHHRSGAGGRRRPGAVMPGPGGESGRLVRDVLLRDGSTLRLQAAAPGDFGDIKEFFDGLSPQSRYLRFHSYGRADVAARAAAEAGGVDRVALIARHGGSVVAVAGFDGLREPRRRRGRVCGGRRLAGPRRRDADARAARGNRGGAWDQPVRCGGHGRQPGDAGGVRGRRLRRAAPGFVW